MTHVSEQSTTFNPETLHILGSALDDAWQRLEVRVHLNGSGDAFRTLLDVTFNPETRHILGKTRFPFLVLSASTAATIQVNPDL